jgi:phosphatidylinositol-3,4,5-trisphosphate 3-phosphatase/dual-specificity protein phosphatase PTEN
MATNRLRHLVSRRKRRFIEDGYDLDMTFIKPNIVAMGFPAENFEGVYRNNMQDVARYFDSHYPDHYKVYNLCSERSYDPSRFHQRVASYPFDDHNAPPFELIKPFCEDVDSWLKKDPRNIAVIHCKAGKGRTGVMICSYLLHDNLFDTTKDALQFYGEARTQNAKGVTIPSQRRYVQYYGHVIRNNLSYTPQTALLRAFRLEGIPQFTGGTCIPSIVIKKFPNSKLCSTKIYENIRKTDYVAELMLPQPVPLCGDIKVEFYHNPRLGGKEKMFQFWFNTFFIDWHVMQQEAQNALEIKDQREHKISGNVIGNNSGNEITNLIGRSTGSPLTTVSVEHKAPGKLVNSANGATPNEASGVISALDASSKNPLYKVVIFPKSELDKANKDKKRFPSQFKVHMIISEIDNPNTVVDCQIPVDEDELYDHEVDEDNLSDTDEEDEWAVKV